MRTPMCKDGFRLAAILSIVLAALLAPACSRTEAVETNAKSEKADAPVVAVAKATTADLSHSLKLTAEFRPYQEVEVMAKVAGYVKQIYVDVGDRVKKDQLLAVLEVPELADDVTRDKAAVDRARADVARAEDEQRRAESAHEITHISYSRLEKVSQQKPGLVAQQEIDDARSKDLVSEAQVDSAKSALVASRQQVDVNSAELSKVRTMIEYTKVTAPFAGVITKRYANTGSMIQAGIASNTQAMPLVSLSENAQLRLILPVPESAVPGVHIGQQVEVKVPTLNRSFPGRVARFSDKLQLSTRTMDTEVDVSNPSLVLIPGMYAEVNLTLAQKNNVLTVPVTAVDVDTAPEGGDGNKGATSGTVMLIGPENHLEVRKVKLGLETSTSVEIREGLQEGDLLVIGNRGGLQTGQRVRPKITTMGPG
jgi:RND family efflux transporter MFP subunit